MSLISIKTNTMNRTSSPIRRATIASYRDGNSVTKRRHI